MAGAANIGWVTGWDSLDKERTKVYSRLPVTGIINAPDMEVVAIAVSQGRAGSSLESFLYVLGRVRDSGWVGVPQDRVAIKPTGVVGGISPADSNRVITGPGA